MIEIERVRARVSVEECESVVLDTGMHTVKVRVVEHLFCGKSSIILHFLDRLT